MYSIVLTMSITVAFIVFYVIRRNPFAAALELVQSVFSRNAIKWHFAALFSVLVLNKYQLQLEKEMPHMDDITPFIYQIEGNLVYYIQLFFEHPLLTFLLTYFYIIVFTALMVASFIIYFAKKDYTSFYALFYGIMINYIIAIPFYLFFPVNEVWFFHSQVKFLIPQVYPAFELEYRALSGLNNCFPSLHTSLSVTMALLALKSRIPRMGSLFTWSAGIIIFSIFYLGIHWVIDMIAGCALGLFAASLASKISEYYTSTNEIKGLTNLGMESYNSKVSNG